MKAERDWISHLNSYPDRIAKSEPEMVWTQSTKAEIGPLSFFPDKRAKTGLEPDQNTGMIAKTIVPICYPNRRAKREKGMTRSTNMKVE